MQSFYLYTIMLSDIEVQGQSTHQASIIRQYAVQTQEQEDRGHQPFSVQQTPMLPNTYQNDTG